MAVVSAYVSLSLVQFHNETWIHKRFSLCVFVFGHNDFNMTQTRQTLFARVCVFNMYAFLCVSVGGLWGWTTKATAQIYICELLLYIFIPDTCVVHGRQHMRMREKVFVCAPFFFAERFQSISVLHNATKKRDELIDWKHICIECALWRTPSNMHSQEPFRMNNIYIYVYLIIYILLQLLY